jgi:Mrp family chromosome partitioning ATPase
MIVLATLSQKVGVDESTHARLIAREYASADWKVKLADLDISQERVSTGGRADCWLRLATVSP